MPEFDQPEYYGDQPEDLKAIEEIRKNLRKPIEASIPSMETKIDEVNLQNVQSFEELYQIIYKNGGLPSSIGYRDAEYWVKAIEDVRAGTKGFEVLTSTFGLRSKVQELLSSGDIHEIYSENAEDDQRAIEDIRAKYFRK